MYRTELHPTYSWIIVIFHLFGYWRNGEVITVRKVAKISLYLLNVALFHILIITCAGRSVDRSEILFLAQVEIIAILMTAKLFYLWTNKDTILMFLNDSIVGHSIADRALSVQVDEKVKKFMKFVHIYLAIVAMAVLVFIISPLPAFSGDKRLPMFIIYLLDWSYSESIYWIIYLPLALQIFSIFVINLLTVIVWYVLLNCSIKYEILGHQLKNLGVPKSTTATVESINLPDSESFHQDLIRSIENHQKLFEMVESFRCNFSSIFIAQIVTTCVSICSSNYILVHNYQNDLLQLIAFMLTFLYGVVNIFVLMYLGNSINCESNRLSYCLFESNWYEQSKPDRKCVLILGEMLKRPHQLVMIKLFPMNLITFATVVNFAIVLLNATRRIH